MKDTVQSFAQSLIEVSSQHKGTVSAIVFGALTSFANLIDAIPSPLLGKIGAIVTILAGILLANYHRKNARKADLESRLLEIRIEREERELSQRRRKEDQNIVQ